MRLSKGFIIAAALIVVPLLTVTMVTRFRSIPDEIAYPLESPAGVGSAEPNLTVDGDGKIYLSWVEEVEPKGYVMRFATRSKGSPWSAPQTIASGEDWFVNAADFPSLAVMSDGSLAAHWLVETGLPAQEAYHINISTSRDKGKTWSKPVIPYMDRTAAQHGFVSLVPLPDDRLGVIWLDGRKMTSGVDETAFMYSSIGLDGTVEPETQLDGRVCDCCQTSAAATQDGFLAVYRDRSDKNVRDISILQYRAGQWSGPRPVADDGWVIYGCPINGPAISLQARNVVVAWFTAPGDQPSVQAAFSSDGGKSFGKPVRINEANPIGRVDAIMLPSGNALVTWIDVDSRGGHVRVRRMAPDGKAGAVVDIGDTSSSTSSGFPRLERTGNEVVVAWTETGHHSQVRTAVIGVE